MLREQSEIAAIIGALDQYHSKGRGAGRPSFLALWDGRDLQVDRIQRGSLYVPSPWYASPVGCNPRGSKCYLSVESGSARVPDRVPA